MKKARIMIVEDEILIAINMKAELSSIGYEVCKLVVSGEDAKFTKGQKILRPF